MSQPVAIVTRPDKPAFRLRSPRPLIAAALLALSACGEREAAPATPDAAPAVAVAPEAKRGGETLKAVRARGALLCGVNEGLVGFAYRDNRGVWRGLDADVCRAVAAAVLGAGAEVRFVPVSAAARFEALRAGRIDLLVRNTTVSFSRDVTLGIDFPGVVYYDGQGFLVRRALNLTSAAELGGARVCVQAGSTSERNLIDHQLGEGISYDLVTFPTQDGARAAYQAESCDAYTADISLLAATRSLLGDPGGSVILPDVISKEPLGPAVREGDAQWADVVRWTLAALVLAEELKVTAKTAEGLRATSADPAVRRLLGVEAGLGAKLGLADDWAFQAIVASGNYGEMFERNVGRDSPLRLRRGLNALWNAPEPGLMYAAPLQ